MIKCTILSAARAVATSAAHVNALDHAPGATHSVPRTRCRPPRRSAAVLRRLRRHRRTQRRGELVGPLAGLLVAGRDGHRHRHRPVQRGPHRAGALAVHGVAYQQVPSSVNTSSVAATDGSVAPHATVIGGSPKAAFCSAPAVTCRWARSRTRTGSAAMNARQMVASAADSDGAGIATGVVGTGLGLPLAAGPVVLLAGRRARYATRPAITARGTATSAAKRAARRTSESAIV